MFTVFHFGNEWLQLGLDSGGVEQKGGVEKIEVTVLEIFLFSWEITWMLVSTILRLTPALRAPSWQTTISEVASSFRDTHIVDSSFIPSCTSPYANASECRWNINTSLICKSDYIQTIFISYISDFQIRLVVTSSSW